MVAPGGLPDSARSSREVIRKGTGDESPTAISERTVADMLGAPPHADEVLPERMRRGVALGLSWTPVGGNVLFVEAPPDARRRQKLLDTIDTGALVALRDRALLSLMLYSFARVSAVLGTRRQDYFGQGSRGWFRLHEKGGNGTTCRRTTALRRPSTNTSRRATSREPPTAVLFQSVDPAGRRLTGRALQRRVVRAIIKRRAAAAGLPPSTCCHTFRATGITAYLSNGGTLEHAPQIAGHASPKTTKLYDRTADTVTA